MLYNFQFPYSLLQKTYHLDRKFLDRMLDLLQPWSVFDIPLLASLTQNIGNFILEIGAAIIVGAATVISSVYIASLNARKAKERAALEAHRERKAEVYNEFMEMVIALMRNTKEPTFNVGLKELDGFYQSYPLCKKRKFNTVLLDIIKIWDNQGGTRRSGAYKTIGETCAK